METKEAFHIRKATEEDCGTILQLIKGIAEYEKLSDQVVATEADLRESLFEKQQAEVVIGEENGVPVGFALFCANFSTFVGKAGLYLEDLFVWQQHRGKGYGKALFVYVAGEAARRGCQRLDWVCLDWNKSAQQFYRSMNAVEMSDWRIWRLQGEALRQAGEGE